MTNEELASLLLDAISSALAVVVWYQRGNVEKAREAQARFRKLRKGLA